MKDLHITMPSDRELVATRVFDAPRERVFEAWTSPALLRRWYGPLGWSLVVCEVDLRVGGSWRFVTRRPDGREIGQRGIYVDVVPPARLVHTEAWEDWNPGELVVAHTFEGAGGKTTLTSVTRFPSREVRDMLIDSGMSHSMAETYARLDELLLGRGFA